MKINNINICRKAVSPRIYVNRFSIFQCESHKLHILRNINSPKFARMKFDSNEKLGDYV